jgi:uncharacterized protein (DUF2141 family)
MLNRMALILLVFFATSSFRSKKQNSATHYSEVSGIVLTEEGLPAVDFQVCTQIHGQQTWLNTIQTCCLAKTDKEGRFTINDLKPGKYEFLATNDSEGYSIANQTPGLDVVIDERHSQAPVTIRLRHRGAVVVARITDKTSGKPLDDAFLFYEGVDCDAAGNVLVGVQGKYSLPIPTDCGVTLVARAKGYKGWIYTDAENPSRPLLKLAAGQRKLLDIQLERTGDQLSQK